MGAGQGGADPNRSLERGIEILRAFRAGIDTLGNGELAERTGLPRSTVSRLTQTLARAGMLDHLSAERTYRLSASVLSLAHAVRVGSPILTAISPLMRLESAKARANVGLATADRSMMVYLESVRYNARASLRSVVAGQQVPMELTSLGRAYLAGLEPSEREAILVECSRRCGPSWGRIVADLERSIAMVGEIGYCAVSWQPGVLAVATPFVVEGLPLHVINMSVQNVHSTQGLADNLGRRLLAFAGTCRDAMLKMSEIGQQ
jgi:DNA-binding IclR family transcriptional regulator